MKITRRQLKRIIKEAMPKGGAPDIMGAIGHGIPPESQFDDSLDHEAKASMVMEAVQQNRNNPDFINSSL